MNKKVHVKEWILQVEYDLGTAEAMFKSGRNIYCIFMCHLSIEKALKALYQKSFNQKPPKVHSLLYLTTVQRLELPKIIQKFIGDLDDMSVTTRYPEDLIRIMSKYDKNRTKAILQMTRETVKCLKEKLRKS